MSIISKFNLDNSLFEQIGENIDALQSTSSTKTLTLNKKVHFTGSINGVEIPASVTLRDARLSRLSVLRQTSPYTGKEYLLVTGVMKPVKMDLEVTVDGVEMDITNLLYKFVNSNSKTDVDYDKFVSSLRGLGFNYVDGMPLFFQQFGASETGVRHAIDAFKAAGAVDVTRSIENPGRIVAAYQHNAGVPVTTFEIGTTDRSKSRTGQGFLNFTDAAVDTFQRVYGLRLQSKVLSDEMAKVTSQDKIKKMEAKRQQLLQLSRQWVSNWSGSQQRTIVSPAGVTEKQDIYDPVNAPCGRFTIVVNGAPVSCDLWSNSARANNAEATGGLVDETKVTATDDDLPF